MSVTSIKMQKN